MAPKKRHVNSKIRKSQKIVPQLLPLYEIISEKDKEHVVTDAMEKLETLYNVHENAIENNTFLLVLRICGLPEVAQKIDWRDPIQSLKAEMESMNSMEKKPKFKEDFYLINTKSSFNLEFKERVQSFFEGIINDDFIENTKILKLIFDQLEILSQCNFKNIRATAMQLVKIVIYRHLKFFHQLVKNKEKIKSKKISTILKVGYIDHILRPRLKDSHNQPRNIAFELLELLFLNFQEQLIEEEYLNDIFSTFANESAIDIIEHILKVLASIVKAKSKTLQTIKKLQNYLGTIIQHLEYIALCPNKCGIESMKLLLQIKKMSPTLDCLRPQTISKIFEYHASEVCDEGLKVVIKLFYHSLFSFEKKEELANYKEVVIVEIIHLLSIIKNQKLFPLILREFFIFQREAFSFEDMFVLLMSQYYNRNSSDIQLQMKEIAVLLQIIVQYNKFVRKASKSEWKTKEEHVYNKAVLGSSKDIFYDKITKNEGIFQNYLKLYCYVFLPVTGVLENNCQFVEERVIKILQNQIEKSIEDIALTSSILKDCVEIYKNLNPNSHDSLIESLQLKNIVEKYQFQLIDILKISSVLSRYEIWWIMDHKTLTKLLELYPRVRDQKAKMEIISLAYTLSHLVTKQFLQDPAQELVDILQFYKENLIRFLIEKILLNENEDPPVQLATFKVICRTLRNLTRQKFQPIPAIFYEVKSSELVALCSFIEYQIPLAQSSLNFLELTHLMNTSFQLDYNDAKLEIIKPFFDFILTSVKHYTHPCVVEFISKIMRSSSRNTSQFTKYIEELIKTVMDEDEHRENQNWYFWKYFNRILYCIPIKDEEEMQAAINLLISKYFKSGKNSQQLCDRLTFNFFSMIQNAVFENDYEGLKVLERLLKKVHQRFHRITLNNIYVFLKAKTEEIEENQYVIELEKLLEKLQKSHKKKDDDSDSEEEQKSTPKEQEEEAESQKIENEREESENKRESKRESRITRESQRKRGSQKKRESGSVKESSKSRRSSARLQEKSKSKKMSKLGKTRRQASRS